MSTATAEPEAGAIMEVLVQQPERSVLFIAKRDDLRLVHTGRYPIMVPTTGQRIGMTAGVVVPFANREFRCPLDGDVKMTDHVGGAGEATMPARELLEWLESHPRFGDPNEGFIRVDPQAPPMGFHEQQALVDAATRWDVETLEAIIRQEREGWNREDIIRVAEGSIQQIKQAEARIRADQDTVRESEDARVKAAEERADKAEKAVAALEAAQKKKG